jgi:cytoskeleton protein RodZ
MPLEHRSSGFGGRLRDARERRGVSLRQIANATKISVAVLDALERDDISKLPGGIFGRAFVRSYAVEVGLDPDATIQDFITHFPNDSVVAGHPAASNRDEDGVAIEGERRTAATFLWLIAISIPLVGGVLYFATLSRPSAALSLPLNAANATEPARPAERPSVPPADVRERPPASSAPGSPEPVAVDTSAPSGSAAAASTGALDLLRVTLTVKRPCWVSATVDGQKSIERLLQPGEQPAVAVRQELVLTAGDASAIALQFNGADARALGKAGEVVTARFTLTNYKDFLQAR